MKREDYKKALESLRKGHPPLNMDEVKNHAITAAYETKEFVEAITECCIRLKCHNDVLRETIERRFNDRKGNS